MSAGSQKLKQLLSFAIGGLLGDVFLHLLPEAWVLCGSSGKSFFLSAHSTAFAFPAYKKRNISIRIVYSLCYCLTETQQTDVDFIKYISVPSSATGLHMIF